MKITQILHYTGKIQVVPTQQPTTNTTRADLDNISSVSIFYDFNFDKELPKLVAPDMSPTEAAKTMLEKLRNYIKKVYKDEVLNIDFTKSLIFDPSFDISLIGAEKMRLQIFTERLNKLISQGKDVTDIITDMYSVANKIMRQVAGDVIGDINTELQLVVPAKGNIAINKHLSYLTDSEIKIPIVLGYIPTTIDKLLKIENAFKVNKDGGYIYYQLGFGDLYIGAGFKVFQVGSLYLYNRFLSLLNSVAKKVGVSEVQINGKNISIDILLNLLMRTLVRHIYIYARYIPGFNSKSNIFLTADKQTYRYIAGKLELNLSATSPDEVVIYDSVRKEEKIHPSYIVLEIMKAILHNGGFSREFVNKYNNGTTKGNRKEYAKVWQDNNLRVKNQTDKIIKKTLNKINNPEIRDFILSFRGFEIDERTDIKRLNVFFEVYYEIIKLIEKTILASKGLTIKDLTKNIFLKIRKLGQYKATGIFFPKEEILSVQVNTWKSLVHETGHFIHYTLADLRKQQQTNPHLALQIYDKILNVFGHAFNDEYARKYPTLGLYILILKDLDKLENRNTVNIKEISKFYSRILELYPEIGIMDFTKLIELPLATYIEYKKFFKGKRKYSDYGGSSEEIFARLFDTTFSTLLRANTVIDKENLDILLKSEKAEKVDNYLYVLDNKVKLAVSGLLGTDSSKLQDEFISFIKNEL